MGRVELGPDHPGSGAAGLGAGVGAGGGAPVRTEGGLDCGAGGHLLTAAAEFVGERPPARWRNRGEMGGTIDFLFCLVYLFNY